VTTQDNGSELEPETDKAPTLDRLADLTRRLFRVPKTEVHGDSPPAERGPGDGYEASRRSAEADLADPEMRAFLEERIAEINGTAGQPT